jgi:hypothetical protein
MKRTLVACLVAVAVTASLVGVAHAAAPRIVIVSGKPLARQVVISDWAEIFSVVQGVVSVRPVPRAQLAGRPRLKVSMFWGPIWNEYLESGNDASALRPRQADQFGGFYPTWRGHRALIDLPWAGRWPRAVSAKALRILRSYGVPIRLT